MTASRSDRRLVMVLLSASGVGAGATLALFLTDLDTAALTVLGVSALLFGWVMWAMDKSLRAAVRRYREGRS